MKTMKYAKIILLISNWEYSGFFHPVYRKIFGSCDVRNNFQNNLVDFLPFVY